MRLVFQLLLLAFVAGAGSVSLARAEALGKFERLLDSLAVAPVGNHAAMVREFFAVVGGSLPVVETNRVIFLARGDLATPPGLQSDLHGFEGAGAPMSRLGETDWFYRVERMPRASRLEYRFTDGARVWCDPSNPRSTESFPGKVSVLEGPEWGAPEGTGIEPSKDRLIALEVSSAVLGGERRVIVQLPPDYRADDPRATRYPVLYLLDGDMMLNPGVYAAMLERHFRSAGGSGRPSFIAVYVPPVNRRTEYRGDPAHVRYFVEELIPAIDRHWRTVARPEARALLGHSRGGLGALHLALGSLGSFGHCLAVAPAVHDTALPDLVRKYSGPSLRFVIGECRFDRAWGGDVAPLSSGLVQAGHEVEVVGIDGGHNLGTWRALLPRLLGRLWAASP